MIKKLLFTIILSLCLCLLMSVGASASVEPEKDARFTITISAPRGWYTDSANVTIILDDVNGTGFEKAEVRHGQSGRWQDISDGLRAHGRAHLRISDNGTVFVSVTDKKGKAHLRSLYIECFDREPPTVNAKIENGSLVLEVHDELSGVESVFINGNRFEMLPNGKIDIKGKELFGKDDEEILIYAIDHAGNRSKTVSLKNPNYVPPAANTPEPSQPAAAPPPESTPPPAPSAPPAAPAPPQPNPPVQAPPPSEPVDDSSVTPTDGSGTVIENSEKTSAQREFFTITSEKGNDFYIVVDKEKSDKNVYLLAEVTEEGLLGLTKPSDTGLDGPPFPPPDLIPEPEEPTDDELPEPLPEQKQESGAGSIILIVIVAVIFGGAAYYIKIIRPKRNAADPYDDDEEDYDDSPDGESDDDYDDGYDDDYADENDE